MVNRDEDTLFLGTGVDTERLCINKKKFLKIL